MRQKLDFCNEWFKDYYDHMQEVSLHSQERQWLYLKWWAINSLIRTWLNWDWTAALRDLCPTVCLRLTRGEKNQIILCTNYRGTCRGWTCVCRPDCCQGFLLDELWDYVTWHDTVFMEDLSWFPLSCRANVPALVHVCAPWNVLLTFAQKMDEECCKCQGHDQSDWWGVV